MDGPGSWFPKIIIGFIAAICGIKVLLMLLAPFASAILLAGLLIIGLVLYGKAKKARSAK